MKRKITRKMIDISVLIPVYRESKIVIKTLKKLVNENVRKEIILIVDEPTQNFLRVLKQWKKKIKVLVNKRRVGKARALNQGIELAKGEVILFLDADVEVQDENFLEKVLEEMEDCDILDIKKEVVKDSWLSRLTYYEYLGFNITVFLFSRILKKCPGINGSAFAIKREVLDEVGRFEKVVCEDTDFTIRVFLKEFRLKYSPRVKVYNHVHSNLKNWLTQRKRWYIGSALWIKKWWRELLKFCCHKPQLVLPSLLFLYPSLTLLLIHFFLPNSIFYKLFSLFLFFLTLKFTITLPFLVFSVSVFDLVKGLITTLLTFILFGILFKLFSKKLKFEFKWHEFFIYYFFYSLTCLILMILALVIVCFTKKPKLKDWKV